MGFEVLGTQEVHVMSTALIVLLAALYLTGVILWALELGKCVRYPLWRLALLSLFWPIHRAYVIWWYWWHNKQRNKRNGF